MKDRRIEVFRTATFALIESLDAVVRLARWRETESTPEPLRVAAGKLIERLSATNRLAGGTFNGTTADTTRVTKMCATMKRLDAAYVTYRKEAVASPDAAAAALELEVGAASTTLADLAPA
jgi:hypothetical protein